MSAWIDQVHFGEKWCGEINGILGENEDPGWKPSGY